MSNSLFYFKPCLGPAPTKYSNVDEDEDDLIGPLPPGVSYERSRELEMRAHKMKVKMAKAAASDAKDDVKRESW